MVRVNCHACWHTGHIAFPGDAIFVASQIRGRDIACQRAIKVIRAPLEFPFGIVACSSLRLRNNLTILLKGMIRLRAEAKREEVATTDDFAAIECRAIRQERKRSIRGSVRTSSGVAKDGGAIGKLPDTNFGMGTAGNAAA